MTLPSPAPQHHGPLLTLARESIHHGLEHGVALSPALAEYAVGLHRTAATFVTLKTGRRLRGCIGRLEASQALVIDVADNAYAAAFKDPRFEPLSPAELTEIHIKIAILSEPSPLQVAGEDDLLDRLRPGIDGVILSDGTRHATYLPAVWDNLPEPRDFIRELKAKMGRSRDGWSASMRVERYTVESFGESPGNA